MKKTLMFFLTVVFGFLIYSLLRTTDIYMVGVCTFSLCAVALTWFYVFWSTLEE